MELSGHRGIKLRGCIFHTVNMFWLIELLVLVREEHCIYQWSLKAFPQGIFNLNSSHLVSFFLFGLINIHHIYLFLQAVASLFSIDFYFKN